MANKFGVYGVNSVKVAANGYTAKLVAGAVAEREAATFDAAYDAALELGGDRWVISSVGTSEYVEPA